MSGCLCSLVTIAWSPPDRGSGHPFRCMAKDSVSDHALHSFPTPIPHPAGILGHNGCADVLRMLAGCGLHKERQSLVFVLAYTQFSFSHHPIKVPAVFLPSLRHLSVCSQAYRQARAGQERHTYPNPHHAPIRS